MYFLLSWLVACFVLKLHVMDVLILNSYWFTFGILIVLMDVIVSFQGGENILQLVIIFFFAFDKKGEKFEKNASCLLLWIND